MRRLLFTLFTCFTLSVPAYSQQAFRYSTGGSSWRFPYTGYYRQKTNYGNDILEELARDFLRPPKFVNITIGFKKDISLLPVTPASYQVTLTLSDFSLSGYLQYRSFPIADVLTPGDLRFKLKLSTKLDTGNFTIREFTGEYPALPGKLVFRVAELAMDTAVDTLITGDFSFSYTDSGWKRFYERKNLIDDYYATSAMIDSLDMEVQHWDMTDPRLIPLNYIRLSELVRMLELIKDRDFGNTLIMGGGDPKHLLEKHLSLFKISRTCMFNLSETLERSGVIKANASPDSTNDYFIGRLMRFIRLSSLMDKIQGRIYKDYLTTYFSKHVFGDDTGFIGSVLIRIFPDAHSDTLLSWGSESLMQAYRRKAKGLIAEKKYSDAVMLMENAHSMAEANPYLKNHNGWENMMSDAVNGVYNAYTGIASSSLDGGNVSFAMEYLQQAEKYRKVYPLYITSDSVYRKVYRAIFIGQLDHCNSLLEAENFSEAFECLKSCEQTYTGKALEVLAPEISLQKGKAVMGMIMGLAAKSLKALKAGSGDSALAYFDKADAMIRNLIPGSRHVAEMDSLAPSIAAIRVKKINTLASAYFQHRQFARAILQYDQAGKISAEYNIPAGKIADSLYRQSYKQWLLDRISQEQRLVWGNKPDSAENFLVLASETAKSKGLENDADILKALSSYRLKIHNQACELVEDSLLVLNIRAGRCFALHNYNRGVWILHNAIYQAGRMSSCRFDLTALQDSLAKYSDPAEYMNKLDVVNRSMAAGDYETGLQILAANENFYSLKRIDHFGLPLTSVYDYVMNKSNPFISIQALEYYCAVNEPVEALRYLMLLHVQGMPYEQSVVYQEKLARLLAAKDKPVYLKADPQDIVRRYSASNSWMNRFTEVYLQEWKTGTLKQLK
ncbi:MAG: hypothetical protein NTW31_09040 [Bacteroidetes bacterium]|nr:hypothetical protein [Bacteroidota bacterium]